MPFTNSFRARNVATPWRRNGRIATPTSGAFHSPSSRIASSTAKSVRSAFSTARPSDFTSTKPVIISPGFATGASKLGAICNS